MLPQHTDHDLRRVMWRRKIQRIWDNNHTFVSFLHTNTRADIGLALLMCSSSGSTSMDLHAVYAERCIFCWRLRQRQSDSGFRQDCSPLSFYCCWLSLSRIFRRKKCFQTVQVVYSIWSTVCLIFCWCCNFICFFCPLPNQVPSASSFVVLFALVFQDAISCPAVLCFFLTLFSVTSSSALFLAAQKTGVFVSPLTVNFLLSDDKRNNSRFQELYICPTRCVFSAFFSLVSLLSQVSI